MPTMKKISFMISFVLLSSLDTMITAQERSTTVHTTKISSPKARALSPRASKVTTSISKKETPIRSVIKKTEIIEQGPGIHNKGELINTHSNTVELINQNEITLDAPEIQNEPAEKDDTKDILEKLALINNIDTSNLKTTQDSSYAQLFNNFVSLKNFIVHNFSKAKFQKLCKELIDQIYPEDAVDGIDFGASAPVVTPAKISSPEVASSLQTTAAAPTESLSQAIPMNDAPETGISFDVDNVPTQQEPTPESSPESTPEEPTTPESDQYDAAPSQPE